MKCKASEHESMLINGTPGNSLHSKIIDKERRMNGWKKRQKVDSVISS